MADYEVEDYQEYTEDEDFQETFGDYSDEEDDSEYYARSFDSMTDEERNNMFGSRDFMELLNELDLVLNNSKKFFFKNKRIIDAKHFSGIIDDIIARTPGEISKGMDIIAREGEIIQNAEAKADNIVADADRYDDDKRTNADTYYMDRVNEGENEKARIIDDANREAARLTSEHQITMNAREEGKKIIENAKMNAADIVNATNESVEKYKKSVNEWAETSMNEVIAYCFDLLSKTRQQAMSNINDIDNKTRETQANLSKVRNQLGFIK